MTTASMPAKRSRWMGWKPPERILADSAGSGPTKPSQPGYVGFEGDMPGESPIIQATPQRTNVAVDREPGVSWMEWKAAALNRLFQEQGVTGQPSRITAATVEHGEKKKGR